MSKRRVTWAVARSYLTYDQMEKIELIAFWFKFLGGTALLVAGLSHYTTVTLIILISTPLLYAGYTVGWAYWKASQDQ